MPDCFGRRWKTAEEGRRERPLCPLPGSRSMTSPIWSQSLNSWQLPETPRPISCTPTAKAPTNPALVSWTPYWFFYVSPQTFFSLPSTGKIVKKIIIMIKKNLLQRVRLWSPKHKFHFKQNWTMNVFLKWLIRSKTDCVLHEMPNVFSIQFSQCYTMAFSHSIWRNRKISPCLKSPHISGVSCCLQTILVALQEKLQEEPAEVNERTHIVHISNNAAMKEMPCLIICHSWKKKKTHTQAVKGNVHYFFSPQDGGRRSASRYELWHQSQLFSSALESMLLHFKSSSEDLKPSPLCFKVRRRQWCLAGHSRDCCVPQCCIWNPTWEPSGKNYRESEEEVVEGGEMLLLLWCCCAGVDMIFLFSSACLIVYVRALLRVIGCGKRRMKMEKVRRGCW